MSISLGAFMRHLPLALRHLPHRLQADGAVVEQADGRRLVIRAEPAPPRRLSATLALPRCLVTLAFDGWDAPDRDAFVREFDRVFQRGGG